MLYNVVVAAGYKNNILTVCDHTLPSLVALINATEQLLDNDKKDLYLWSQNAHIMCACDFEKKLPLILANNDSYFPKITLENGFFGVIPDFPVLEFIAESSEGGYLGFSITSTDEASAMFDIFDISASEIDGISFGELNFVEDNIKDSEYTLIITVSLSEERKQKFQKFINDGSLAPFIEAFEDKEIL